ERQCGRLPRRSRSHTLLHVPLLQETLSGVFLHAETRWADRRQILLLRTCKLLTERCSTQHGTRIRPDVSRVAWCVILPLPLVESKGALKIVLQMPRFLQNSNWL